ncbi:lipoyl(octanoyl) transferase LipB [Candidatus Viridilinea mediisalina]|uniref:Octanoyltransferase n=1 Tax=Candidatus Viridilinea mediisalina TaxID=2024553 RepID=A0A2A6RHQ8_9CHLR|nr:lipoyl(octanoyl) transferase LipB [Candidatus Viridilinea mediisalina]PDW02419.1 octanoyltransferase [Candidatus Viridilinea mediisalina]
MRSMQLIRAGCVAYAEALAWQQQLVAARSVGQQGDTLLLLEHPPTITLGVRANPSHVLVDAASLAQRGVALVQSDRGGDVTYHAPGQLVGYPILKLCHYGADVGRYVRNLEEVIIRTLADYELEGVRMPGLTGVWVDEGRAKICALGVRLSAAGITSHGFAFNLNPDLGGFAQIVPCGITQRSVTSLAQRLGHVPDDLEERLLNHFAAIFGITWDER